MLLLKNPLPFFTPLHFIRRILFTSANLNLLYNYNKVSIIKNVTVQSMLCDFCLLTSYVSVTFILKISFSFPCSFVNDTQGLSQTFFLYCREFVSMSVLVICLDIFVTCLV